MAIWWSSSMEDANNNWDLHAVVRGCSLNLTPALDPLLSCVDCFINEEVVAPDIETTMNAIQHELEELCRPFFSNPQQPSQEPAPAGDQPPEQEPRRRASHNLRSKRRKSQQKKVVCEVPADGASPDVWAWRKYGQKPIKGSPYPRGYYRCSSSKGCLARKQVERNRTDPTTLIITYTAEHNHPVPTHRNSLAGSTRTKFPDKSLTPNNRASSPLSTLTPLTVLMEEELLMPKDDVQDQEINGDDSGDDMVSMDSENFRSESGKLFSDTWQLENSTVAAGAGVR